MSRIKVVFFDAAGTLFHVKGSVGEIYLRYAEKYGVLNTPAACDAVNAAFTRALRDAPPPLFAPKDPLELKRVERLWWFDVLHTVFYRVGMFEGFDDFFEEVFQGFDGGQHWTLYSETLPVLRSLQRDGFELGIISNFDTRIFSVLRDLELSEYFSTVTISSLTQAAKPAPRIFHQALHKHVMDPEEALHVGDNLVEDAVGAVKAGLEGVWIDRQERRQNHLEESGFTGPCLPNLEPLPDLLAKWD